MMTSGINAENLPLEQKFVRDRDQLKGTPEIVSAFRECARVGGHSLVQGGQQGQWHIHWNRSRARQVRADTENFQIGDVIHMTMGNKQRRW